jgi:hypothetical protein
MSIGEVRADEAFVAASSFRFSHLYIVAATIAFPVRRRYIIDVEKLN